MIGAWADVEETATEADHPAVTPVLPLDSGGINQLAFLVGGTWVSKSGSKGVEETCVWGAGNQSIRTTVVLRSGGEVVGRGQGRFNCSPTDRLLSHSNMEQGGTDQRVYSRQVPFEGGPVHGAVNQWHFEAVFLSDAGVQHRQMVLSELGPDAMRMDQSMLQGGKRVSVGSAVYARKA